MFFITSSILVGLSALFVVVDECKTAHRSTWKLWIEVLILITQLAYPLYAFGINFPSYVYDNEQHRIYTGLFLSGFFLRTLAGSLSYFLFSFAYLKVAFTSDRAVKYWVPAVGVITLLVFTALAVLEVTSQVLFFEHELFYKRIYENPQIVFIPLIVVSLFNDLQFGAALIKIRMNIKQLVKDAKGVVPHNWRLVFHFFLLVLQTMALVLSVFEVTASQKRKTWIKCINIIIAEGVYACKLYILYNLNRNDPTNSALVAIASRSSIRELPDGKLRIKVYFADDKKQLD